MANFNFYFVSCVLLVLTLSWRTSTGVPVPGVSLSAEKCAQCSSLFKDLLLKITEILKSAHLCFGILSNTVVVHNRTETVLACVPTLTQNSGCTMQRNSSFSESECLKNIMNDLSHFSAVIQLYLQHRLRSPDEETKLLTPALGIINSLRENCSLNGENGENDSLEKLFDDNSYNNRQKMCERMRGFYVRTITINRAMGYISSGDHKK